MVEKEKVYIHSLTFLAKSESDVRRKAVLVTIFMMVTYP